VWEVVALEWGDTSGRRLGSTPLALGPSPGNVFCFRVNLTQKQKRDGLLRQRRAR